jgi:anti-sigma B factor antagonist
MRARVAGNIITGPPGVGVSPDPTRARPSRTNCETPSSLRRFTRGVHGYDIRQDDRRKMTGGTGRAIDFDLVTHEACAGTFVVALSGEVDLYTAPELNAELLPLIAAGPSRIVVDMTEATFVDSTAFGVLLGAAKRLRLFGGELVIVCSNSNIRRILSITLLDRAFTIYDTLAEALAVSAPLVLPPA